MLHGYAIECCPETKYEFLQVWSNPSRHLLKSGQLRKTRPKLVDSGPCWPKSDHCFKRNRTNLVEPGRAWPKSGQISANDLNQAPFDHNRPNLVEFGQTLANVRPTSPNVERVQPNFGQLWREFDQHRQNRPISPKAGRIHAKFGRSRPSSRFKTRSPKRWPQNLKRSQMSAQIHSMP